MDVPLSKPLLHENRMSDGEAQFGGAAPPAVPTATTPSLKHCGPLDRASMSGESSAAPNWVFKPRIDVNALATDSRPLAVQMFARVQKDMVPEIDDAVKTGFQGFCSTLPGGLTSTVMDQLQQGWLLQHYVECVVTVVERMAEVFWTFQPAVALDKRSVDEAARASV